MDPEVQPLNGPSLADSQENPDPPQQEGGSKVNRIESVQPQEEVQVNPGADTPGDPSHADPQVNLDPPQEPDKEGKGDRDSDIAPNDEG